MVAARRTWWDDVVFEDYPTWEEAVEDRLGYFGGVKAGENTSLNDDGIKAAKNSSLNLLKRYFEGEGDIGARAYARCVKYGIGRKVLARMLPAEAPSNIQQALTALPLTRRARRGLELKAQKERERASQILELAQQLDPEERREAEMEARAAAARAARQEEVIKHREWYDARASKVFDRTAHGRGVGKPSVMRISAPTSEPKTWSPLPKRFVMSCFIRQRSLIGKC